MEEVESVWSVINLIIKKIERRKDFFTQFVDSIMQIGLVHKFSCLENDRIYGSGQTRAKQSR